MVRKRRWWYMLRIQRIKDALFGSSRQRESGLTIVELAVVVVVLGVIFPIFSALIVTAYRDVVYQDDRVKMTTEVKQALWYMDDGIRTANSFVAAVPNTFTDPYGPHGAGTDGAEAWSYRGDSATSRVIITQSYSTTVNALNTGRQAVFKNTSQFNCTTEMYYQPQLSYTSIYFVQNQTLYRRTLVDTTTALCPGNAQTQKQSCPPTIAIGSRQAPCQANDEILATKISEFSVKYYQIIQDGTSIEIDPTYSSSDPAVLATADYVVVTIGTSSRNGAVTTSLTHRMTKVNQI